MTVFRYCSIVAGITMALADTYAQGLFSPRSVALGSNGASVLDTRGFENNPAGLVGMRDWELTTATYGVSNKNFGFVFQGIILGKRFLEHEALAIKFSPGSLLEFVTPSEFADTSYFDQKISYEESFALGFAHRFSDRISAGLNIRYRTAKLSETQLFFTGTKNVKTTETEESSILGDLGALWRANASISVSALVRNLVAIRSDEFPAASRTFSIPNTAIGELGIRYSIASQFDAFAAVSTKSFGSAGCELRFPGANVGLQSGLYFDKKESPAIYAVSIGAGWSYEFLQVDASYLRFFNQRKHNGEGNANSFDGSLIQSLDLNPFTQDRIALSLKAIFGNVRESLARIEGVEITSAVYPSSYELFAFRPIGNVRVRNISGKPIEAKASFFVETYMNAPTESPAVYILPGEAKEIPFNAVLNDKVKTVDKLTIREGNVYVNASAAEDYDDKFQTKVLIHGRNDWDGDVQSLRNFVTPDVPEILRYTRDVLLEYRDSISNIPRELELVVKARLLCNSFAGKLVYVGDPKQSSDYVQYPSETLAMRSGDCDDMTTAIASLLSSVGISTAFIDVVPPQSPEKSHIYLLFDTELEPRFGNRISENPKRFVIRKNPKGVETIWLPIETTVIAKGFDEAWSVGAQEFLNDTEIGLGLIKGWVRIVDVN